MGMFDYVMCERVLPDGFDGRGKSFQTKDFDCEMTTYTITQDGRLVSDDYHHEEVPKAERKYPNEPDDSLLSFLGCMRRVVDLPDVDRRFHGLLNFYGSEGDVNTMNDEDTDYVWHEYRAKFTDGKLDGIEALETRRGARKPSPVAD